MLGLRVPQLLVVALGAGVLLVGLLRGGRYGPPLGVLACGCAACVAFLPVQGRPLVEWVRPVANFAYGRLTGQGDYLGGPWAVHTPTQGPGDLRLPGIGSRGRVRSFDAAHGEVAVIRQGTRWTAVLQVSAPAYPLADRATQQERVSAWGSLLAQLGQEGSRLAAVQWLERTIPDSRRGLQDWWAARGVPSAACADHYQELIADAGPAATRHETFVAVSIEERRCRRAVRAAGGGPDGISQVLVNELSWIEAGLRRCDVQVLGWVGPMDLGRLVRTQYDPLAPPGIDSPQRHGVGRGMDLEAAGPMASPPRPPGGLPPGRGRGWGGGGAGGGGGRGGPPPLSPGSRPVGGSPAFSGVGPGPGRRVRAACFSPLLVRGGGRPPVSAPAEP